MGTKWMKVTNAFIKNMRITYALSYIFMYTIYSYLDLTFRPLKKWNHYWETTLIWKTSEKQAWFLVSISWDLRKEFIWINSHYMEKILKKYNYFDYSPASTPYDPSVKLFKNTSESVRQIEYTSIIDSLRYATNCTRLDIAYVVGLLCRFTSSLSKEHWQAIEQVMRSLKKAVNLGLHYIRFPDVLEGYNDVDWNTLSDDSKSGSGYIFNIAGVDVSWKSKKQTILAHSTIESEMIVIASEEASWLGCLLSEISVWEKLMSCVDPL